MLAVCLKEQGEMPVGECTARVAAEGSEVPGS